MAQVVPSGHNHLTQNQPGLTNNVEDLSEKPAELMQRTLLPGEQVLKEFDCFFPSYFVPKWILVQRVILTCGLYLFVLAYRAIARWCYRIGCCRPSEVYFKRGKMAITNKGRIICWDTDTSQIKTGAGCCMCIFGDTCGPPVSFSVQQETRIYDTNKIRQMDMYHESQAMAICCCFFTESGIRITFDEFADHWGVFVSTGIASSFVHAVRTFLGTIESYAGLNVNDHTIYVVSSSMNAIYDGNTRATVEDLSALHTKILELVPQQPDIVVRNDTLPVGSYTMTDETSGFNMLDAGGKVNISNKWFNLAAGEQIISVTSEVYLMNIWDKILTCLTLGCYYCCVITKKKEMGGVLVLTNKRIVEVTVRCRKIGHIPAGLDNVAVQVSSFYPGQIMAGFMTAKGKDHRGIAKLRTGVLTSGGRLDVTFWRGIESINFAKALQSAHCRVAPKSMSWPDGVLGEPVDEKNLKLLTLMPNETVRASLRSQYVWTRNDFQSCCYDVDTPILGVCGVTEPLCTEEKTPCFPWLPYCLTCGLRPFIKYERLILTDTSIMQFEVSENFGCCGFRPNEECKCSQGPCKYSGDFFVSWSALSRMTGHSSMIKSVGHETCMSRCFKNTGIGKLCCALSKATFKVKIDVGPYNYQLNGAAPNHNWTKDSTLANVLSLLGNVQQSMKEGTTQQPGMMMQPMAVAAPMDIEAPQVAKGMTR